VVLDDQHTPSALLDVFLDALHIEGLEREEIEYSHLDF
jgi:hypothetical protein